MNNTAPPISRSARTIHVCSGHSLPADQLALATPPASDQCPSCLSPRRFIRRLDKHNHPFQSCIGGFTGCLPNRNAKRLLIKDIEPEEESGGQREFANVKKALGLIHFGGNQLGDLTVIGALGTERTLKP